MTLYVHLNREAPRVSRMSGARGGERRANAVHHGLVEVSVHGQAEDLFAQGLGDRQPPGSGPRCR